VLKGGENMANDLIVNINADTEDMDKGLADIKQNLAIVSGTLMEFGGKIADAFAGIVTNVLDANSSMLKFQNQTGTGNKDMAASAKEISDIYKNNFGDSLDDVSESMAIVKQQSTILKAGSVKDMGEITTAALVLKSTFGYDVSESVRTAGNLVKNFGMDGKEAMDLIAKGTQMGLNQSDDLLDTLYEYSPQFSRIGLKANDMFNILKKGSESGIFTLDKVGDAIKEFGIRVTDGSTGTSDAMKTIGLNADKMAKAFLKGGDEGNAAFYKIIDGLGKIKDPVKQNQAGVALFGTMWEDLGGKTVLSLGQMDKALITTKGTVEKINKVNTKDFNQTLEGIKRTIETDLLKPLGEALTPALKTLAETATKYLPIISEEFKKIDPNILAVIAGAAGLISILLPLIGIVGMLLPAFEAVGVVVGAVFAAINLPIIICMGILAALIGLGIQFRDKVGEAFTFISTNIIPMLQNAFTYIYTTFMTSVMPIIQKELPQIQSTFMSVFNSIVSNLQSVMPFIIELIAGTKPVLDVIIATLPFVLQSFLVVFGSIITFLSGSIQNIISVIGGFINIIIGIVNLGLGIISGDWSRVWTSIKTILQGVWQMISGIVLQGINLWISTVGSGLQIIWNLFASIFPNAANIVSNVWNNIKNAFSDGANRAKTIVGEMGNSIPSILSNMGSVLYNAGSTLIQQLINGLWSKLQSVKNVCKDIASSISNFFPHSPAKEGALKTFPQVGGNLMQQLMDGIDNQKSKVLDMVANVAQGITNNVAVTPSLGSVNSNITIPIFLDGKKITEVIAPQMTKMIRAQGGY
jgi:TP901 family phage tail tape measure protein